MGQAARPHDRISRQREGGTARGGAFFFISRTPPLLWVAARGSAAALTEPCVPCCSMGAALACHRRSMLHHCLGWQSMLCWQRQD